MTLGRGARVLGLRKNWTMQAVVGNIEVLFLAILAGLLTLLPMFVPVGATLLIAFVPFPFIVLAVKYPWRYAVSLLGVEGGLILLVGQPQFLFILSQCGLVALVTAWAIRRGWSISQTIVASLVAPLGIGALLLALYSTLAQPLLEGHDRDFIPRRLAICIAQVNPRVARSLVSRDQCQRARWIATRRATR